MDILMTYIADRRVLRTSQHFTDADMELSELCA